MSAQIKLNKVPNEPSLSDLLSLLKKDIMLSLCAHHLGTVRSFDSVTQTATATINYKKTFFEFNEVSQTYSEKLVDYPTMLDCPVIVLGGGLSSLTFPISPGDECLVLFNDRDIDNWFAGSVGGPVASSRFHSFSDAIILVGVHSLAKSIPTYDTIRAVLSNGQAMVGVGPSLIKIANNITTLNTLLQTLVTDLQTLISQTAAITVTGVTPGGGVSGPPLNAAAIAAVSTSLSTLSSQISGLLE